MGKMRRAQLRKIRYQLRQYCYLLSEPFKHNQQFLLSTKHMVDENGNFIKNKKLETIYWVNRRIRHIDRVLNNRNTPPIVREFYIVEGESAI